MRGTDWVRRPTEDIPMHHGIRVGVAALAAAALLVACGGDDTVDEAAVEPATETTDGPVDEATDGDDDVTADEVGAHEDVDAADGDDGDEIAEHGGETYLQYFEDGMRGYVELASGGLYGAVEACRTEVDAELTVQHYLVVDGETNTSFTVLLSEDGAAGEEGEEGYLVEFVRSFELERDLDAEVEFTARVVGEVHADVLYAEGAFEDGEELVVELISYSPEEC